VSNCAPVATIGFVHAFSAKPFASGDIQVDNNAGGATVEVETYDAQGNQTDSSFHIVEVC
jgi:hypothetical protein